MKLSVIAPTYNEAENIRPLLAALQNVLRGIDYEIVIADDDSPDLTWALAEEIGKGDSRIRVLRRTRDRGLGASVIDAFACAKGEALACIDADLQHDPGILPTMLAELERGADLVVGSRYVAGGGTESWKWIRRLGSRIATRMAQSLVGIRLSDPMSGYFMLRREDFLRVRDQLNGEGFKILLEIVTHLKPSRMREIPYVFRARAHGRSKLSRVIVVRYLQQLWRLRRQR
jgi:dolichol-phosphate mannosyltransferase